MSGLLLDINLPTIILPSYYGHLLYTPNDLEKDILHEKTFIQLDIGDLLAKDFKQTPIADLCTSNALSISILSYYGSQGAPITCDSSSLSLDTFSGRKKVTMSTYLERIHIDKPKVVVALADEIDISNSGTNRTKKGVNRTWSWFKELSESLLGNEQGKAKVDSYRPSLFGVLVIDPHYAVQVDNMIDGYIKHGASGIRDLFGFFCFSFTFLMLLIGIVISNWHYNTQKDKKTELVRKIREKSQSICIMSQGVDSFEEVGSLLSCFFPVTE
jgi:hypothetical protein